LRIFIVNTQINKGDVDDGNSSNYYNCDDSLLFQIENVNLRILKYNFPCYLNKTVLLFKVDRSQIEEVQLSDEAAELQVLGLSVYDQATLEKGIIQQVDQALEQLDCQQLEEQMKSVADKIM
jgi:hypothetical protein